MASCDLESPLAILLWAEGGPMKELTPLAPTAFEVIYAIATLVAVIFAAYAMHKVTKREWPVGFALTLALFTLVVPFSGPAVVGLRTFWHRCVLGSPTRST